ncbi:hypothetical protein N7520_010343 [Penicillium odoratum]|uniref:uncharacterized protein n=1 Tax=Penicillium odoratum TaxID=1167516 RepID=UPI0025473351|nr:uncharacterized protein N7520_010343 [Penicillium odoratum]KAJ5745161.1 hypothetical protein N7520_010343 [Penicillium odoratum]
MVHEVQSRIFRLVWHPSRRFPAKPTMYSAAFSTESKAITWKQEISRWLRNEKQNLALHHFDFDFDFDALCARVLKLSGKQGIINCEKMEGGSNRAFIFTFNDNWRLVAKLQFKVTGPATLTAVSEVATSTYRTTGPPCWGPLTQLTVTSLKCKTKRAFPYRRSWIVILQTPSAASTSSRIMQLEHQYG